MNLRISLQFRITVLLCVALVALVVSSCEPKSLPPDKYVRWVKDQDNGLTATKKMETLEFSLFYQPTDYLVLRELDLADVAKDNFDQTKSEFGDLEYYLFKIKGPTDILKYGATNREDYFKRVNYYSFDMQQDLQIIASQDTLPCKLFHFERNYGAAPYIVFSLGFESPSAETNRRFQYNESIFGLGPIELLIKQSDINATPTLAL